MDSDNIAKIVEELKTKYSNICTIDLTKEQVFKDECKENCIVVEVPDESSEELLTDKYINTIVKRLKPDGVVLIKNVMKQAKTAKFLLQTSGMKDVSIVQKTAESASHIMAHKPKYSLGSSVPLNQPSSSTIWKLDQDDNEEEDFDVVDEDDLLSNDDLVRPDPSSLRVCGTTGQRKACKDCSCGLAEELSGAEAPQTKSSCGNCYLGDAFRCSSCPYLGMPAFKPGEKVSLDLVSDI